MVDGEEKYYKIVDGEEQELTEEDKKILDDAQKNATFAQQQAHAQAQASVKGLNIDKLTSDYTVQNSASAVSGSIPSTSAYRRSSSFGSSGVIEPPVTYGGELAIVTLFELSPAAPAKSGVTTQATLSPRSNQSPESSAPSKPSTTTPLISHPT
jgi:hypothetical protein